MARRAYNSQNVTGIITYKGQKNFIVGVEKGSSFKASKNSDKYKMQGGMKGEGAFSATNDNSGKIEFSLMQDSPTNKLLDEICNDDETFDIEITDGNEISRGFVVATECVLNKQADWERGAEMKARKWVVSCPNLKMGDE